MQFQTIDVRLIVVFLLIVLYATPGLLFAQQDNFCEQKISKRTEREYNTAVREFVHKNTKEAARLLRGIVDDEPDFVDAHFVLGLIYIDKRTQNLKQARHHFETVIELCPDYDPYAYYHLADILYGSDNFKKAIEYLKVFTSDVNAIKSEDDYHRAVSMLDYAEFYQNSVEIRFHSIPNPLAESQQRQMNIYPSFHRIMNWLFLREDSTQNLRRIICFPDPE